MSLKADLQKEIDNLEMRLKENKNSLQELKEIKDRLDRVKLSEFEEDIIEEQNQQILLKG
jgi:hypothetical protein